MANKKTAGILYLKINGEVYDAKGNFTYNLGRPKREEIVGADRFHGFKEMPQASFIEGELTDNGDLDVKTILDFEESTITLELRNGKTIVLKDASFAGEGNVQTEEGNIAVRFVGSGAEEI